MFLLMIFIFLITRVICMIILKTIASAIDDSDTYQKNIEILHINDNLKFDHHISEICEIASQNMLMTYHMFRNRRTNFVT